MTMSAQGASRRSQRLIDREFQQKMILRLGGIMVFYFLMCLLVVIAVPMALAYVSGSKEEALAQAAFRLEVLFKVLLVPLLVTFAALWIHGIQETFRIAGPNYRFKAVMKQLHSLVLPRGVNVRDADLLQDTAAEFDRALVRLHDWAASVQTASREAVHAAREATPGCSADEHRRSVETAEALSRLLAQVELVGAAPACEPLEPIASSQAVVKPQEESAAV